MKLNEFRWLLFAFFLQAILVACTHEATVTHEEKYRPQFHFSPPAHWMNDPNGLVYFGGEYHLFYQFYPDSTVWGPMHWGHAIATDLVHWKHMPVAIYPDSNGYIFSGSAVIDWKNTTGFQTSAIPPIVAMYTRHDPKGASEGKTNYQTQCLAFSNDSGRTMNKYEKNPVLVNPGEVDFRDPHIFWHDASRRWILALAVGQKINFYSSPDLKSWGFMSDFGSDQGSHGGVWECPDLFPLPIGDSTKWVLFVSINPGGPNQGSATQYFIGDFDGNHFTNDNADSISLWLDYGPDNYAGVSWSDIPKEDNRRIYIGWMSNWNYGQKVPTESWRSAMTIPRSLELKNSSSGIRLASHPVREMEKLREAERYPRFTKDTFINITGLNEVMMTLDVEKITDTWNVTFANSKNELVNIGFDKLHNQFFMDRSKSGNTDFSDQFTDRSIAPRFSQDGEIKLHLFLDRASVELFADDGLTVMTAIFFPTENFNQVRITKPGTAAIKQIVVYDLQGIGLN